MGPKPWSEHCVCLTTLTFLPMGTLYDVTWRPPLLQSYNAGQPSAHRSHDHTLLDHNYKGYIRIIIRYCFVVELQIRFVPYYTVCYIMWVSYVTPGAAWLTAQLSLLVLDQHICHYHDQHSLCVGSKFTCTHLCTHVGLKIKCGQAHCWHVAILRQQRLTVQSINQQKFCLKSEWRSICLLFKGHIIQMMRCIYISGLAAGKRSACYTHRDAQMGCRWVMIHH